MLKHPLWVGGFVYGEECWEFVMRNPVPHQDSFPLEVDDDLDKQGVNTK